MEKPQRVYQAEIAIWATIALSAISSLANRWLGYIDLGEFAFTIILYGCMCIIPYKIGRGSNAARYVYSILFVASILFMLGGVGEQMPKLDVIVSIIIIPVEIFIVYQLFQPASSSWFSKGNVN